MSASRLFKIASVLANKGIMSSVVHASASNTVVASDTVGAEIRRMKDNKLFRSVVETNKVPANQFIKHLASICEQVEDALGEDCYVYWKGTKFVADNGALKSAGQAVKKFQEKHAFAATTEECARTMPPGVKADIELVCGTLKFLIRVIETEASRGKTTYHAEYLIPRLNTADKNLRNILPTQYRGYPEVGEKIADALERIDVLQDLIRSKHSARSETPEIAIKTARKMIMNIIEALH